MNRRKVLGLSAVAPLAAAIRPVDDYEPCGHVTEINDVEGWVVVIDHTGPVTRQRHLPGVVRVVYRVPE